MELGDDQGFGMPQDKKKDVEITMDTPYSNCDNYENLNVMLVIMELIVYC